MKDLEKIKSEDLAAQVQDANPGNFAIEQEVAQLVGATVPAPTEPSADDARELGAQLLVFLRRALLPIRSALRTAVAAIYAHLDSRCTAYTPAAYASYMPHPYDPMGTFVPRTLPNLLQAITAFSARKISNGSAPNDGIPDGVSLAHLLCGSYADVAAIVDDNKGWTARAYLLDLLRSIFPNATKAHLNMSKAITSLVTADRGFTDIAFPYLKVAASGEWNGVFMACKQDVLEFPEMTHFGYLDESTPDNRDYAVYSGLLNSWSEVKEVLAPKLQYISTGYFLSTRTNGSPVGVRRLQLGTPKRDYTSVYSGYIQFSGNPKLIDFEICADGGLLSISLNLSSWNPSYVLSDNPTGNDLVTDEGISTNLDQFLHNFREHIALRLTSNGSGLTLTLSQAVRDAIHAAEATYGIEAIIVTQKGWRIQPDAS